MVGLFGVGVLLGFILLYYRGLPMLLLGGYLYTGGPKGYKYLALGDVLVFLLMGPLMVVGSYYALTGGLTLTVFLASLPVGSLVAAIMAINNHRDAATDREAEVRTLSNVIGFRASVIENLLLPLSAYLAVVLMAFFGVLPVWSPLTFLCLPLALANLRDIKNSGEERARDWLPRRPHRATAPRLRRPPLRRHCYRCAGRLPVRPGVPWTPGLYVLESERDDYRE